MAKIAVLGFGTVGSGVVELFYKNQEKIQKHIGTESEVKYILDLRDFPDSPYADRVIHQIDPILADPEITAVAECMGGVEPAFTFVKSCLEAGKSVATSNKELVAEKGDILLATAKEHHCNFAFEASVGGAIPIIRPLHKDLAANDIYAIHGILNGTTNFILAKMITDSMQFSTALELAQSLGYAEKDPTADIEGHDACRKICILSSLVFGKHVYPSSVSANGITGIELEDVELARMLGGAVKLIAGVERQSDGRILPYVMPMFVPYSNLLSRVDGVFNAVEVSGDGFGTAVFYGKGAGKLPTASAVLGDLIDVMKHDRTILSQQWESSEDQSFIAPLGQLKTACYLRYADCDQAELTEQLKNFYAEIETEFCPEDLEFAESASGEYAAVLLPELTQAQAEQLVVRLNMGGIAVQKHLPILE